MSSGVSHDGPDPDDFDDDFSGVSFSMSWPSSGPSEDEVPMSALFAEQSQAPAEQRNAGGQGPHRMKNPLPSSGSRRDQSGSWSVGSEGHEAGLCQGPCRDLRSGRGCTFGSKCKMCHFPHPEVSSTSIRTKKSRAKKALNGLEFAEDDGADNGQQQTNSSIPGQASAASSSSAAAGVSGSRVIATISL
eukprot:TRINITY_DN6175_c0_g1_i1.p1 TRINITY_DN6175_c0_g1~~TRINITY_DN6175_c0_g1_i1.p1  ORF type:complete len:189 (-),score=17.74 TRINITY_DN6175_c0_g1_i1:364-930(-)